MIEQRGFNFDNCSNWPFGYKSAREELLGDGNYTFPTEGEDDFLLAMQAYAGENLAEIKLAIKAPSVQTMTRARAVTFVNFVGSTGGLLGLCLGFSFVSLVEFVYYVVLDRIC